MEPNIKIVLPAVAINKQGVTSELYALLWSRRQEYLHIEAAFDTVCSGLEMLNRDNDNTSDYIVIYLGTRDDCDLMADRCRPQVVRRRERKHMNDTPAGFE